MFVSASTQCFADKTFHEACALLTDLEYDKVEIWLDESSDHLKPGEVAGDPEAFATLFRETTRLAPIAMALNHNISATEMRGISKAAKLLKIAQITVPSSPLGSPFNQEVDRLKEFLQITGEDGIRLSIKTERGMLTEDPHTAVELCQAIRGLGLTLDPSHYICGPNRGQSYDQVYPYVFHTHLRDTSPTQFQVQTGLGEVDYSHLVAALERENYNRALSVDLIPSEFVDIDRALEMRKIRMLLETLL